MGVVTGMRREKGNSYEDTLCEKKNAFSIKGKNVSQKIVSKWL